jgi:hypothetical protein
MRMHIQGIICILQVPKTALFVIAFAAFEADVSLRFVELIRFILLIYISKKHHALWSGIGTFSV